MKLTKGSSIMLAGLLAVIGGTAQAAEQGASPMGKMTEVVTANSFDKKWGFSLGVKVWMNQWDLPLELGGSDEPEDKSGSYILQFESDSEVTYIPAAMVRYRNFFIGGSYLPETDYDFTAQIENDGILWDPSGDRKEWDLNIGYFITPNLAVSLGYKRLERDIVLIAQDLNDNSPLTADYPLDAHAPIIGLAASLPVGKNFNFYGNLAYGWLSGDSNYHDHADQGKFNDFDLDGNYYLGELGLNYVIPLQRVVSAVTINAGYRFQRLEMKFDSVVDEAQRWGSSGDQNDSTSGFILGITAMF